MSRKPISSGQIVAAIILAAVAFGPLLAQDEPKTGQDVRVTPVVSAVRAARDAVVNISTERIVERSYLFGDAVFKQFFMGAPLLRTEKETSLGSGVIIDESNHVLTNAHVILKASEISVKTSDGSVYPGKLVGWDVESDIAVIKVHSDRSLPHARIGTAKDLMIGETVITIGNPYGYSHTVTTGVVSAMGRDVDVGSNEEGGSEILYDLIQTDAAINPGNSGGPLINLLGGVVGINTAILGSAEGMGFAIPIDRAMRLVEDLITYGEVHTPWLGLCTKTVELSRVRTISGPGQPITAVVVTFVFSDGPLSNVVTTGDIIDSIGETPLHTAQEFRARLKDYKKAASIPLGLTRNGQSWSVKPQARAYPLERAQSLCWEWLGFWVQEAQPSTSPTSKNAYLIVSRMRTRAPADKSGLRVGDILTQIDDRAVQTIADFQKAMMAASGRDSIYVEVQRGLLVLRGTIP